MRGRRKPAVVAVTVALFVALVSLCGGLTSSAAGAASEPVPKSPAPRHPLPASGDVYMDLVKKVLESLSNSANSYECYQKPSDPKCQMGGMGDLFRFFGSTAQKEQVAILERLAQISAQLSQLQRTTDQIATTTDQTQYLLLKKNLNGNKILDTMNLFNGVAHDCEGKTQPYEPKSVCESWLGKGDPSEFYRSDLGTEIYQNVASVPWRDILTTVQGGGSEEGLFAVLPKIVSNTAKERHFFSAKSSDAIQSYFFFYISVETAFITLWSNYWQARPHPSTMDVQDTKLQFIKAVEGQVNHFKALPAGTTVDMRTGLMWSTENRCLANSLQSPAICGTSQIAGFPLTATCPPGGGAACQLQWPLATDSEEQAHSWIDNVRDTAPQSSWKVPTEKDVNDLLRDRGSDGAAFLRNNAQISTNSEYTWTSTMWCPSFVQSPRAYTLCVNNVTDTHSPPLRVSFKITTGDKIDNKANACDGGPCRAVYIFFRRPAGAEYTDYGIVPKW